MKFGAQPVLILKYTHAQIYLHLCLSVSIAIVRSLFTQIHKYIKDKTCSKEKHCTRVEASVFSQQWARFPNYCRCNFNTIAKSCTFQYIVVLLHMDIWSVMGMEDKSQLFFPPILIHLVHVGISNRNLLLQWHMLLNVSILALWQKNHQLSIF